eukprot:gene25244-30813_t
METTPPEIASVGRAKRPRLTIDPPKPGTGERVKVQNECLMTYGEAEATNNRLPKGYLYVPLDAVSPH